MTFLDDIKFISRELGKTKREISDGTQKIVKEFIDVKSEITDGAKSLKTDINTTKNSIKKEILGVENPKDTKNHGYGDEPKQQ